MKCRECGADATVHLTDIVDKKKRETHLCEACARERNLLPAPPGPQLNLQALLALIMGQPAAPAPRADDAPDPVPHTCPACGLPYAQFRAEGRLGCPADYDAFKDELRPLLERAHRGLTHAGKIPRAVAAARRTGELDTLKAELADAVAAEDYERAAALRDRLREGEAGE